MYPVPQDNSEIIEVEAPESKRYLRLLSVDKWAFRGIWVGVGIVATNLLRLFPTYHWFYIGLSVSTIAALLLFPSVDIRFKSLWRSGAIALFSGLVLPWWEMTVLVPAWVWFAIVAVIIAILALIGGGQ